MATDPTTARCGCHWDDGDFMPCMLSTTFGAQEYRNHIASAVLKIERNVYVAHKDDPKPAWLVVSCEAADLGTYLNNYDADYEIRQVIPYDAMSLYKILLRRRDRA